jgi:hypothetical protein
VVFAATLATTAAVIGGRGAGGHGSLLALAAARNVTLRPEDSQGRPTLSFDVTMSAGGTARVTLLGGATFADFRSTKSILLLPGQNHVRLRLSTFTEPGTYRVNIGITPAAGGVPTNTTEPFRVL